LKGKEAAPEVRARALEAAGKIAASVPPSDKKKAEELGTALLTALDDEGIKAKPDKQTILFGITAVLRAKPENGEFIVAKFLTNSDARIRADAANTLSRLKAKNANEQLRAMLFKDKDPIARANAARAIGAAEDKFAFDLLLGTALNDEDARVRVSSIRTLGTLKDARVADRLLERGEMLLANYKKSRFAVPPEKNELLEIATTIGRILSNTNNERAVKFLTAFDKSDDYTSPETEIALARVSPKSFQQLQQQKSADLIGDWRAFSATAQAVGELASLENNEENNRIKIQTLNSLQDVLKKLIAPQTQSAYSNPQLAKAVPDLLRAYAQFKTADFPQFLRAGLKHKDVIVRATAIELLGELPAEKIQFSDFEESFRVALDDEKMNDALLATIEAIGKQKTERAADFLKAIVLMPPSKTNYTARRRVIALLKEKGAGDFSNKLGAVNSVFTPADYIRAVSRRRARAILITEKGTFTITFFPQDAPLTVENFIKLARRRYFDGLTIHRVVPNFVVQDGDPRGDGNGSPGWEIRDEINMVSYERGTVGMALSGKDTGGSQWFVTHSPQPHLDGGYTVFGRVNETDMKIVDNLARGDKILSVKIVEGNSPPKNAKARNK
jgi:cyclophilin family peptidyl-prolyl cis-trans isomerase/HEAT repeat protein